MSGSIERVDIFVYRVCGFVVEQWKTIVRVQKSERDICPVVAYDREEIRKTRELIQVKIK